MGKATQLNFFVVRKDECRFGATGDHASSLLRGRYLYKLLMGHNNSSIVQICIL
jgi:hypothetical protein